jgi:hypothetical protein
MISRNYAWINEEIEHSDSDCARAVALAKKWSQLMTVEENRHFTRMADQEDGRCYDFDTDEELKEWQSWQAEIQAERDLEIELVEDKLAAIGARMMRPYEHWNEDERYMEYMESRYDNEY